ncbi:MAG: photosynthetic complex assembly protein PuhC [Pseudomonadota bacterium]
MEAMSNTPCRNERYQQTSANMRYLGILVLIALVATLTARLTGYKPQSVAPSPVVETRLLVFTDVSRGVIEISDDDDGELLLRIGPGEEAFLRSVVRGLARQRRAIMDRRDIPFVLERLADGRLVISDAVSGERIQLNAFGAPNLAVFYKLLRSGPSNDRQVARAISAQ